jgi:hypothetical protein
MRPTDLEWARARVEICTASENRDAPEATQHFTAEEVSDMLDEIVQLREVLGVVAEDWFIRASDDLADGTENAEAIQIGHHIKSVFGEE